MVNKRKTLATRDGDVRGSGAARPAPVPSRRVRSKQEKAQRIIAAARQLFGEKGFDATTTVEVANLADIGTGTLFLYINSKEDLLLMAFLDEVFDLIDDSFSTVDRDAPLLDQLLHIYERLIVYHANDLDLSRHLLREVAFVRNPQMRVAVNRFRTVLFRRLAALVAAQKRKGKLKTHARPTVAASMLFAVYFAPLTEWLNGYIDESRYRHRLRESLELQIAGLSGGMR